jgi:hypothetical protein
MKGKRPSKYDPKPEPDVVEDAMVTTELSDEADNELYLRYKINRWNPDVTDAQRIDEMNGIKEDIANILSTDTLPIGKNRRDIFQRVKEY